MLKGISIFKELLKNHFNAMTQRIENQLQI